MPRSNIADSFKLHYNMMRLSGVWPNETHSYIQDFKAIWSWIFPLALSATMLAEVIVNDQGDVKKLSEILYVMVSVVVHVFKLGIFTYQKNNFIKMIKFLRDPIFMSYPEDIDHYMAKSIHLSTLIANLYRHLCLCCMILFALYPVLDNQPLPFPFRFELGNLKYAFYAFQIVAVGYVAWNNSCLDSLTASLMGVGAAQLDILAEKLIKISEDKHSTIDTIVAKIKQCIQHHDAIIQFTGLIECVFTIGILFQFLASAVVICNTLFHFVLVSGFSSQSFMLMNYFAIMISELSLYCWYGNELMWKSSRIGEACYLFNWYDYGSDVRTHLFIIMERSKKPLAITAWKFSKLSLTAFTAILRWTYSFFALLLKMYHKQSALSN